MLRLVREEEEAGGELEEVEPGSGDGPDEEDWGKRKRVLKYLFMEVSSVWNLEIHLCLRNSFCSPPPTVSTQLAGDRLELSKQ